MTKAQLLKELEPYDDNIEIDIVVTIFPRKCSCPEYCYCSDEEYDKDITGIYKKTQFNKKTKKQDLIGITIRGT